VILTETSIFSIQNAFETKLKIIILRYNRRIQNIELTTIYIFMLLQYNKLSTTEHKMK
jgi:hypothetical protein